MVSDPVERPPPLRKGEDVRLYARKALDYGDANAELLRQGKGNYRAIVEQYAAP